MIIKCHVCGVTNETPPPPPGWYWVFRTTDGGSKYGDLCPTHNDQHHRALLWEHLGIGLQVQWTDGALGLREAQS